MSEARPASEESTHSLTESGQPDEGGTASVTVPVVGIGASAGGVEALQAFFRAMPPDSGMAFIVVLHLQREKKSYLAEILGRCTTMPVVEVTEPSTVAPNSVYLIPPDHVLQLHGETLALSDLPESRALRKPVDALFRSLAASRGPAAIAILLSGTGGNGSVGVRDIKDRGGIVLVQDPAQAAYSSMAQNALDTGVVDCVLRIEQMPEVLLGYGRHPYVRQPDSHERVIEQTWEKLSGIMELLHAQTGREFRCYKKNMLLRRTLRRMGLRQLLSFDEYQQVLEKDKDEAKALAEDLLIGVTYFFRDREAWNELSHLILPPLFADRQSDHPIRAWVPGCASGEEAYTMAILLHEQARRVGYLGDMKVFATDTAPKRLQQAREGRFPDSVEADVPTEILARYFERHGDSYLVRPAVRETVVFAPHDLIADPPFSQLDLISCRNLLIYMEPETQAKILALFHFALRRGGHLFLGSAETAGQQKELFETVSKSARIYRRIGHTRHDLVSFPIYGSSSRTQADLAQLGKRPPNTARVRLGDLVNRALADAFGLAAVLVNPQLTAVHFHGRSDRYLAQPSGARTGNVLEMAREGMRFKLQGAIEQAMREHRRVVETDARVRRDGHWVPVRISVTPMHAGPEHDGLALVTFEDAAALPEKVVIPSPPLTPDQENTAVRHLERELHNTRDELQRVIDELQNANEEQRATNEEISSMNEELQSTNEELETSKEELQSVNEELTTVNQQLHAKVQDLEATNNDLSNLLASTDVATIFLDTRFHIRWFSPSVQNLLPVLSSDVGRPIGDFAQRFQDPQLFADAEQVLQKLTPIARQVYTDDMHWLIRRILPYRTRDNRIEGLVITFTDVTDLHHAQKRERLLATVVHDASDAIIVMDLRGAIVEWNRGAADMYGWSASEAIGRNIRDMAPPQEHERLAKVLEDLVAGEKSEPFESERITRDGRRIMTCVTLSLLRDQRGQSNGIAATERDVTAVKVAEQRQQQFNEELARQIAERTALTVQLRKLSLDFAGAVENERGRIAHVLHDDLQQVLAAGMFALNMVAREHDLAGDDRVVQVRELLQQSVAITRDLSHELSPPILQEGLLFGLDWIKRWCGPRFELDVTIEADPEAEPRSTELRYMLFSTARELLFNVFKHAETNKAEIRLQRLGDMIRLSVSDQGKGFDPKLLEASGGGDGFGLLTLRERVTSLGGQFRIEARPGAGSRFIVDVPDIEVQPQATLPQVQSPPPCPRTKSDDAAIRVLLVDDHEVMRQGLSMLLRIDAGITVVAVAESGEVAIGLVDEHRPDVVLMDVNMPGIGGVEATRRIVERFPDVAVVGLSMYEDADAARSMLQAGAVAYVQKSTATEKLIAAIKAAAGA